MPGKIARYTDLLGQIKQRIRQGQTRAVLAANSEMICMYWDIGRMLHKRQQQEGWGASVIPRLSRDLRNELPEVKGFSERNIKLMVQFHREYPTLFPIGQRLVAQLPALTLMAAEQGKAEYTLRGVAKPIGISEYELTRALPDSLKSALPSIEEIERELSGGGPSETVKPAGKKAAKGGAQ